MSVTPDTKMYNKTCLFRIVNEDRKSRERERGPMTLAWGEEPTRACERERERDCDSGMRERERERERGKRGKRLFK